MLKKQAQIISASRRTDIPAFYADWFMQRLQQGFVDVVNPFNSRQVSRVSLAPEDVIAIVFWTRNPKPLLRYMPELQRQGYRFYFQWTLNRYPAVLEPAVPRAEPVIELMHRVAAMLSPGHIQWRYDPIIFSNITPPEWHLDNFARLAARISGATRHCTFSFADFYRKTRRNLARLAPEVVVHTPSAEEEHAFTCRLQEIAAQYGMALHACCEPELLDVPGIRMAHCVDLERIRELYPEVTVALPGKPSRPGCGCTLSKDIGAYDSCLFRCTYCYANADFEKRSRPRHARHHPASTALIP